MGDDQFDNRVNGLDPKSAGPELPSTMASPVSEVLGQLQAEFASTLEELKSALQPQIREEWGQRCIGALDEKALDLDDPIDHFQALETLDDRSKKRSAEEIERAKQRKIVPDKIDLEALEEVPLSEIEIKNILAPAVGHLDCDVPCQDCIQFARTNKAIVVAQSDGATGTKPISLTHLGAKLLTLKTTEEAQRLLQHHTGSLLDPEFLGELHARIYRSMFNVMREIGLHPVQAGIVFAATLQVSITTPKESLLLALGDGVFRTGKDWDSIEDVTERKYKEKYGKNVPASLHNSIAFDSNGDRPLAPSADPTKHERTIYLAREAEFFHIAGYWATSQVMVNGLDVGSDGNGSVDGNTLNRELQRLGQKPTGWAQFFPLDRILSEFSPAQVELAMHLYNLWYPTENLVRPGDINKRKVDKYGQKHTQLKFIEDVLGNQADTYGIGEELKLAVKTSAVKHVTTPHVKQVFAEGANEAVLGFLINPKAAAIEHADFCRKVQLAIIEGFQAEFENESELAKELMGMDFEKFWDFLRLDYEDIHQDTDEGVNDQILNYFKAACDELALHCKKSTNNKSTPIQHIIEEDLKPRVMKHLNDIFGVQVSSNMAPLGDDFSRTNLRRQTQPQ